MPDRHLLSGYGAVLPGRRPTTLPALALAVALDLVDFFTREHDLVKESWQRTAHWHSDS